jgi:hypothetical protein
LNYPTREDISVGRGSGVKVFKTKEFIHFVRRERITDARLCEAVNRAVRGLIDANLGGGLIKQRIARPGQGRSGGYRTLMAFRNKHRAVFVYGFAKSERNNIGPDELEFWRRVATAFLRMDAARLTLMINQLELKEVSCDEENDVP